MCLNHVKRRVNLFLYLFFILFTSVFSTFGQTKSNYTVTRKFSLEGDGGWDYLVVDDSSGNLFVSHSTMVQVVDIASGKNISTITELKGVHGITLSREFNKGFITNGKDSSVSVFDLTTFEVLMKIKVTGSNPDALIYDNFSKKVFVFNARSSNATVIDAKTNSIIETIALDGKPEAAVSDESGKIYVNIEDKNEICMINSVAMKVEKLWPIQPGEEPSGIALDNTNHRLFSVCDNRLMVVVNALNGEIVTTLPIGDHVDGVAFDPILKRAYSSNGDGTLSVIQEADENSFHVINTVTTQKGARTIALNLKTHKIYLPTAEYGETPPKSAENPHARPPIKPGTFNVLEIEQY